MDWDRQELSKFITYFDKAKALQEGKGPVGDKLMDNVPIYDTIHRRHAGFSNVLEDLHYQGEHTAFHALDTDVRWLFYHVHRLTGSGASFQKDHGYRNSIIFDLLRHGNDREAIIDNLLNPGKPIFTSLGNQIPPFPKPEDGLKGSQVYFRDHLKALTKDVHDLCLRATHLGCYPYSIKQLLNYILGWHKSRGLKRFVFVHTAWVMDLAEYHPELVDKESGVPLGSNAVKALRMLLPGVKASEYDIAMSRLIDVTGGYNAPMDMEDVLCDYIRYVTRYIPTDYADLFG